MSSVDLDLKEQAEHLHGEARMILPGIQALFGFQMVAVFSERFGSEFDQLHQSIHLIAVALTIVAMILTTSPAVYHRQVEPSRITKHFMDLSNTWLRWGLIPLALGVCIDFYLIADIILKNDMYSAIAGAVMFVGFLYAWYVQPCANKSSGDEVSRS